MPSYQIELHTIAHAYYWDALLIARSEEAREDEVSWASEIISRSRGAGSLGSGNGAGYRIKVVSAETEVQAMILAVTSVSRPCVLHVYTDTGGPEFEKAVAGFIVRRCHVGYAT